jgi:hypothetical protein
MIPSFVPPNFTNSSTADQPSVVDQIASAVVSKLANDYPDVFRNNPYRVNDDDCCPDEYAFDQADGADATDCCPDTYDMLNSDANLDRSSCEPGGYSQITQPENDANAQPDEYSAGENSGSPENEDFQGDLREIPGARLVYKRKTETGTYDELWVYVMSKSMRDESNIRQNILAGTDIEQNAQQSPDGKQSYSMWTIGNRQMIKVSGLPS